MKNPVKLDRNNLNNCFELAINNMIKHGDTDIFPFPFETRMFSDIKVTLIESLKKTYDDFDNQIIASPPICINSFSTVGYTGYRWSTQIDPYWNVLFLGLVISLSKDIEKTRLNKKNIYSYRFSPDFDSGDLFDKEISWRKYQEDSLQECQDDEINYILTCDIADFYPRIYHHRLENLLDRLDPNKSISSKIKKMLQIFSETKSYGVPVGCPASRILAELTLDSVDQLLSMDGINFKRYVDDFVIFCSSKEDAHSKLTFISKKLMENEGLTLQKHKTNIMSKEEFQTLTKAKLYGVTEDDDSPMKAKFLSLPIRFDPYSANAIEDYEEIKESLKEFDLLEMLNSELQKSKINQAFSKHLIRAFSTLDEKKLPNAYKLIFSNINELYPIFKTIIQGANLNWGRIDSNAKLFIIDKINELIKTDSFILKTELNLAYLSRLLSKENNEKSKIILTEIYKKNRDSVLITNIVTQAMAKCTVRPWLSDVLKSFSTMNTLQRRTVIISSYLLGDEGKHWREHNKKGFTFIEKLYASWGADRCSSRNIEDAL